MRRCPSGLRALTGAVMLICVLAASVVAQQPGPTTAVAVGTVTAERKPIAQMADFVGRIQAIERVDIQARITGFLEQVLFKEGETVKEGQPLYRIEKDLFQADVEQAQGALEASKAKKLLTAIQYERAEQLTKTSAGTVVARDQALTADRSAAAQILIDQANLETAKVNLGYTDIVAPISGKIGRTMVTKGNVVSPQSGTLTTIVSESPIYVLFPVSQRALMRARKEASEARLGGIKVKLRFADGSIYGPTGKIDFVDVTVDKATDTVQVRAVFPNPKGELIDGQLVSVDLEVGDADGTGRGAAIGLDRRPAGPLCLYCRGREGRDPPGQDRGTKRRRHDRYRGFVRRRAGHCPRAAVRAARHAGNGKSRRARAGPGLGRCSPPSSSTGRGWRSSSRWSRQLPGWCRCW